MEPDWEIRPLAGLGRLRFGMPAGDVAALAGVYGSLDGQTTNEGLSKSFDETADLFAEFFSPEDIAAVRESVAAKESDGRLLTQVLTPTGLVLDYRDDRLTSVIASERTPQVHFGGDLVFRIPAIDTLALFEAANGEPGRYMALAAAFPRLGIVCDGFSRVMDDGSVRDLPPGEDPDAERTIALSSTGETGDMVDWTIHSFDRRR